MRTTSKATKAVKPGARTPAASATPKLSKDELRAQVEKLEQVVAKLRARSREANRAAKEATGRVAELEELVAKLETKAEGPGSARQPNNAKPARARRQRREIDPGDAVPPGVAVQEPAPLDKEAETALENLDEHLRRR